jgi:hypothetical protein
MAYLHDSNGDKRLKNAAIKIPQPKKTIVRNRNLLRWNRNGLLILRLEKISYVPKQIAMETGNSNRKPYKTRK